MVVELELGTAQVIEPIAPVFEVAPVDNITWACEFAADPLLCISKTLFVPPWPYEQAQVVPIPTLFLLVPAVIAFMIKQSSSFFIPIQLIAPPAPPIFPPTFAIK